MMNSKPFRLVLILFAFTTTAFLCFCPLSPISFIVWDVILYPLWINLSAPNLAAIRLPEPVLLHPDFPSDAGSVFWSDDGSMIFVIGKYRQGESNDPNNFIITVDADTREVIDDRRVGDEFDFTSKFSEIGEGRILWDTCPGKGLTISGRELPGNAWELELWEGENVVDTFRLASDQWSGLDSIYRPVPAGAAFSPTCEHFTVGLYGWIYWEGDGQEELWLVDLPDRSIQRVLKGRWAFSRLWDYPVQDIDPSWSPDGDEIVFGDSRFGLEIYDIKSGKRRWLAGPSQSGYSPRWSPSGQWIAVERQWERVRSIILISADSKWTDYTKGCYFISDMAWSPAEDRLAYLCQDRVGGKATLWVWSLLSP